MLLHFFLNVGIKIFSKFERVEVINFFGTGFAIYCNCLYSTNGAPKYKL